MNKVLVKKSILLLLSSALLFCSCSKSFSELVSCITQDATNVIDIRAKLVGEVEVEKEGKGLSLSTYFFFSENASDVESLLHEGDKIVGGNTQGGLGSFFAFVGPLKPETEYYYMAVVSSGDDYVYGEVKSFTTQARMVPKDAVDLGVVITRKDGSKYKLYWADRNLGAETPTGIGNFYAWGDTEKRTNQNFNKVYIWGTSSYPEGKCLKKYCTRESFWAGTGKVDYKIILETGRTGDDAASATLGDWWRIPTAEEWRQLLIQCDCDYDFEKRGMVVKSKQQGNNNSIFIPAAEYWPYEMSDERLLYWSSEVVDYNPVMAYRLTVGPYTDKTVSMELRYNALPIRPVTE